MLPNMSPNIHSNLSQLVSGYTVLTNRYFSGQSMLVLAFCLLGLTDSAYELDCDSRCAESLAESSTRLQVESVEASGDDSAHLLSHCKSQAESSTDLQS